MVAPFWKTAGGKRALLPELRALAPQKFGRYFEPFVGGGALFFDLEPQAAYLNDANALLMAAYGGIRFHVEKVIEKLQKWQDEYRANPEATYYKKRALHASAEVAATTNASIVSIAAWTIFINKTCYNGLWRVSKRKGIFNTPWCRDPDRAICDAEALRACSAALQSRDIVLMSGDFERVADAATAGDFCFFDSPYWPVSATADFTAYTQTGFTPADQVRLRDVAVKLKKRGAHVLLSNANVPEVWDLYERDFELFEVKARRAINSNGRARGPVKELLIK